MLIELDYVVDCKPVMSTSRTMACTAYWTPGASAMRSG